MCTNFLFFISINYLSISCTQLSSDDDYGIDEEDDDFFKMIYAAAMLGQTYVDMFVKKNPLRTSTTSGMGYMMELFNTPRECHRQLRMSPEIFSDLHKLLVQRYGLTS
jgi:hypothetical protein